MLIGKGAEANIYLKEGAIVKKRVPKKYRVKELDELLRKLRTTREARLISLARRTGVATPLVLDVDNLNCAIEMSFVKGTQVKKLINRFPEKRRKICAEIGRCAGRLHSSNIIHGDLTTSNFIFSNGRIYFIDFGLGEINDSVEAKGVDVLVFKRSLRSTHYRYEKECFESFLNGYSKEYGECKAVVERVKGIEHRGRYFTER